MFGDFKTDSFETLTIRVVRSSDVFLKHVRTQDEYRGT